MQIASYSRREVVSLTQTALDFLIEVVYFADSMGSMTPDDTARLIRWLRDEWQETTGIHTYDNKKLALQNTLLAQEKSPTWLNTTVTGMGRDQGVVVELARHFNKGL
jgi:4-hydroxy 2-oxovalerate aldolase